MILLSPKQIFILALPASLFAILIFHLLYDSAPSSARLPSRLMMESNAAEVLDKISTRPEWKKGEPTFKFKPTSTAYMAFNLFQDPDNPAYQEAEKLYYSQKYNISRDLR